MGAALDYRLIAPAPILLTEPRLSSSKSIRAAVVGSALVHLLALAWLPPVGVWQQLQASMPVLQVTVSPGRAQMAKTSNLVKPQLQPSAAQTSSNHLSNTAPVVPPLKPASHLLAVPNGAAEVAVVSSAAATEVKTISAPAAEAAPTNSRSSNEPAEEVAPARVDPAYRSLFKPPYPLSARRRGIEGTVLLHVEVLPSGEPGRIDIARSSGDESLDASAREAARQLRFTPAQKGGKAVSGWANIPYQFRLEE